MMDFKFQLLLDMWALRSLDNMVENAQEVEEDLEPTHSNVSSVKLVAPAH